jgi:hypothetical protein
MDVKPNRLFSDWKTLKNLQDFQEIYRAHMVLVCAADIEYDAYYKASASIVNLDI